MRGAIRGAALAALCLAALPAGSVEPDVTLTAVAGTLTVSGTLRGFDGAVYRVDTVYGLLTIDAAAVTCAGPGCPDLARFVPGVTIVGEAYPGVALIVALAADYAAATGADLTQVDSADGLILTLSTGGRAVATIRFIARDAAGAIGAIEDAGSDLALVAGEPGRAEGRMLALDPLLPVVAPGNPVRRIALRDLRAVQAGAIDNWRDLGGPDMPVALHAYDAATGLQQQIDARLGGPPPPGARRHPGPGALVAAVARDPWALALVPGSHAAGLQVLTVADSCGHVLRPGRFAVKAEDYPLAVAAHLVAPRRRLPGIGRALVDHAALPTAQSALAAAGFADLAPEVQPVTDQGERLVNAIRAAGPEVPLEELQRLVDAMTGAERLSLTFRFEGGARALDAASRTHLADLARMIEAGLLDGRELVFAGFSDGDGDARANLALSRARAEATRAAVAAAAPLRDPGRVALAVEAFGETLPIACDDTPLGRQINRRVEVWLRPLAPAVP
jgi:phosphate transport system substrate-binding protein